MPRYLGGRHGATVTLSSDIDPPSGEANALLDTGTPIPLLGGYPNGLKRPKVRIGIGYGVSNE